VLVHAPHPRGVDQQDAVPEGLRGEPHLGSGHPSSVAGVPPFGDVAGELLGRDLLAPAVEEDDARPGLRRPLDGRDDRGEGDDGGGEQVDPEQGVHEGGLAPLELPGHDHDEALLRELPRERAGRLLDPGLAPGRGQGDEPVQGGGEPIPGLRVRLSVHEKSSHPRSG